MNNSTEHAEFEDFVKRRAFNPGYDLSKATWPDGKESYCCEYVCLMWEAWQAARRAPAAPVPQEWRELAQRCLTSMEDAVHFRKTGEGRPPEQTCLFEIEDLRAMLAAAPQPPEVEGLTSEIRTTKDPEFWRACDLLSMTIGTLMGFRQKLGYTDKSPIAGLVNDAVKFLEPWPEKLPTATKPPEGAL